MHIGCILFCILFCIFHILSILHILHILCIYCILSAYCFAYYSAYFAYRIASIFCIFCIFFCIFNAYYIAYSYAYSAYFCRCILCIFYILCTAYCAYCAYSGWKKAFTGVSIVHCHYCFVPHPRAQLFTYHHLQPSPPFADLSQKAPGKSAVSRRMAKGIVPVAPTGTRGRRPSMEDTGITYKTCACSRRS